MVRTGTALPHFALRRQTDGFVVPTFSEVRVLTRGDILWPSDLKCCNRIIIFALFVSPAILRHALPSTRTQASWVRVPIRPWLLFVFFYVGWSLAKLIPCQRSPTKCHKFAYIATHTFLMLRQHQGRCLLFETLLGSVANMRWQPKRHSGSHAQHTPLLIVPTQTVGVGIAQSV
jgi:hypothetical protein